MVISFWQRNKIGIFVYGGAQPKKFMTKTPANYLAKLAVAVIWGLGFCSNIQSATIPLSRADFWCAASISLALNYPLSELEIDF